ncbi:hypothetical protein LPJ63_002114 [Coemansia sp. RSA 2711]|nr:hypothetical protein LPJ63_002114 [Coemansia sp. RSA 2711]
MARTPITHVETSPQGLVALVYGTNMHVADSAGKVVASTSDGVDGVAKISGSGKGEIITVAFSHDGALLAVCTGDKTVTIFSTDDWAPVRSLAAAKRPTAITFDLEGANLIIADKFGEVHRTPTAASAGSNKPDLLLGHVSIVCDVKVAYEQPYVLTCDRDEKLRVSKYPNAYNIQAFGLGHTEFVTSIATARFAPDNAVTGAGDGTVRLWELSSGRLLQTVNLKDVLAKYYADGRAKCGVNSFEDHNAAEQRYGVLRVRAVEEPRMFVVAVERIPAVVVVEFGDGPALVNVRAVDIARPPTDVAVLGSRVIAAYAPAASEADAGSSDALAVALAPKAGELTVDEPLTAALNAVPTQLAESVPSVPSIYIWGNKMSVDRPRDDE